jgi:hypothetical protein
MRYSVERVLRKYPMQQMCIANIADNLLKIDVIARRTDVDADDLVPLTHKTGRKQTAQTSARASDQYTLGTQSRLFQCTAIEADADALTPEYPMLRHPASARLPNR